MFWSPRRCPNVPASELKYRWTMNKGHTQIHVLKTLDSGCFDYELRWRTVMYLPPSLFTSSVFRGLDQKLPLPTSTSRISFNILRKTMSVLSWLHSILFYMSYCVCDWNYAIRLFRTLRLKFFFPPLIILLFYRVTFLVCPPSVPFKKSIKILFKMVLEKTEEDEFVLDDRKRARLQVKCAQFEVSWVICLKYFAPF